MKHIAAAVLISVLASLPSKAQQTGDEMVVYVLPGDIGFDDARLHLPSGNKTALTEGGIFVDGLLVGFLGDFIPFADGTQELKISKFDGECHGEEFTYRFEVSGVRVKPLGGSLKSSCRDLVEWPAPRLSRKQGSEFYYEMAFAAPVTRLAEKGAVAPAMSGLPKFVLVQITSTPSGSDIYIDDELQDKKTNVRLSIPYEDGIEDENRYLIRQDGLVNCYGTYPLTEKRVKVDCRHRDVR